MTILFGTAGFNVTAGDIPAVPGAAPTVQAGLNGPAQGNPQASQYQPHGTLVPSPQVGNVAQTVNTALVNDLISHGNVPLSMNPTNAAIQPGTDSLLAQMARGQVILNQSTYGQGSLVPQAGGQTVVAAPSIQPVAAGIAGNLTVANPSNYTGN